MVSIGSSQVHEHNALIDSKFCRLNLEILELQIQQWKLKISEKKNTYCSSKKKERNWRRERKSHAFYTFPKVQVNYDLCLILIGWLMMTHKHEVAPTWLPLVDLTRAKLLHHFACNCPGLWFSSFSGLRDRVS